MALFSDTVQLRGGATPQTFDGAGTLRFNERARKLVGMIVSHSLSVYTTDEATGMAISLQSSNWNGIRYFFAGWVAHAGPATNHAAYVAFQDVIGLDIPVTPNTTVTVNVSSVLGATQTGTHDVTIQFIYSDGSVPSDVLAKIGANIVPTKGGSYGYTTALTTTTRTALTGNGTTLNIPAEAKEIVGIVAEMALDTAVTQSEEITGQIEVDYGLADQGSQIYALSGGSPGLGTEVEGGAPASVIRTPVYIGNLPSRELQVNAHVTLYSAITGGMDIALNILWR